MRFPAFGPVLRQQARQSERKWSPACAL